MISRFRDMRSQNELKTSNACCVYDVSGHATFGWPKIEFKILACACESHVNFSIFGIQLIPLLAWAVNILNHTPIISFYHNNFLFIFIDYNCRQYPINFRHKNTKRTHTFGPHNKFVCVREGWFSLWLAPARISTQCLSKSKNIYFNTNLNWKWARFHTNEPNILK